MTNKKVYDLVKQILEVSPEARNSNKVLYVEFMARIGMPLSPQAVAIIMAGPDYESVTRSRRLILANPGYNHLRGNSAVESFRKEKQRSKGTFAFRETITITDPLTGKRQVLKGQNEA